MSRLCSIACFVVSIFLCSGTELSAQHKPGNVMAKKFADNEQLEFVSLNADGNLAILVFEDQYWGISIDGGKTLWTRKLKEDYDQKALLMEWMSPTEIVIAMDDHLEWIDCPTGKSLGKARLMGDGLADLDIRAVSPIKYATENLIVRRHGNVLLVPFDDGYAVYDLKNRKVLFQSDEELVDYRREFWASTLLIHGDMDTAVIIDVDEPRVIYRHVQDGERIDLSLYQNIIRYKDAALLMVYENILCIDATTGKRVGLLGIEPGECESYVPLIVNGKLHLLVQEEQVLKLCDVSTAKTVWSLKKSIDVIGSMMYAWSLPDGDILMSTSNDDDELFAIRLAASSGARVWQQRLAQSEHGFKSGHQFSTNILLGALGKGAPVMRYVSNFTLDSVGVQTYYSQRGLDSVGPYTDAEFMSILSDELIHEGAKAHAVIKYAGVINNDLVLATQGRMRKAWDGKVSDEEDDGEAILKLDPATGKIRSAMSIPFVKDHDTQKFDLYGYGAAFRRPTGTVLGGTHTLVMIKNDGSIDTLGFRVEDDDEMAIMDYGYDYYTIKHETPEEKHIIWKVYMTETGFRRELVGMSESDKYISLFVDTTFAPVTLRWFNDALEAYPVMSDIPKSWPTPLWKITEADFDKLGVGGLDVESTRNDAMGIHPYKDVIYLLGEDALGVVDAKTGCTKSIKWQGWNGKAAAKYDCRLFTLTPGGVLFDMGVDVGIIKSGKGCELDLIGYTEAQRSDLVVVYTRKTSTILVVDENENRLDAYRLTP